jgi:RHH-type transcriptional regulator, rel operon repressor / antitoxin RelB
MLGIRLEPDLDRRLAALAKRQGKTKSDLAREAIRRYLMDDDLAAEARRQSLLVSEGDGEQRALDFIDEVADLEGWR